MVTEYKSKNKLIVLWCKQSWLQQSSKDFFRCTTHQGCMEAHGVLFWVKIYLQNHWFNLIFINTTRYRIQNVGWFGLQNFQGLVCVCYVLFCLFIYCLFCFVLFFYSVHVISTCDKLLEWGNHLKHIQLTDIIWEPRNWRKDTRKRIMGCLKEFWQY